MAEPVIVIFDVGKTNKKILLYNSSFEVVSEKSAHLGEITDEDGDPCEDLSGLTDWLLLSFREVLENSSWHLRGVNFSGYGASFVYLDQNGVVIPPLYNYLKPYPESINERFYGAWGGKDTLCVQTSSPALGSLNSGLQLLRIRDQQPDKFSRIDVALHLPQYLSWLITRQKITDLTSIGCHTHLWDFRRHQYHAWVKGEGLLTKLAPLMADHAQFKVADGIIAGTGLHDSSAALIPYLKQFERPFVLISTGTWSISLNPFNHLPLTPRELQQDCLCYLTHDGKPVKASRLFAGHWHEEGVDAIARRFSITAKDVLQETENPRLLTWALATLGGQSAPDDTLSDAAIAYGELVIGLVKKQKLATDLVLTPGVRVIYVDGGFSRNQLFMRLLASVYPRHEVYAATVSQASALGAAMALSGLFSAPANAVQTRLVSSR
ncbi:MAG: FGGY family carbohydrate kinase [Cyclobacteriaceae bacterium]